MYCGPGGLGLAAKKTKIQHKGLDYSFKHVWALDNHKDTCITYQNNIASKQNDKFLQIPHPRMLNRNFVLFPLFEIEKNWKHPKNNISIDRLLKKLDLKSLRSIKIY